MISGRSNRAGIEESVYRCDSLQDSESVETKLRRTTAGRWRPRHQSPGTENNTEYLATHCRSHG